MSNELFSFFSSHHLPVNTPLLFLSLNLSLPACRSYCCSLEVKCAISSGDYSSIHDFYQRTFSSPIELNALMKRSASNDKSQLSHDDCELNTQLLYAIYDHLDDLVSVAQSIRSLLLLMANFCFTLFLLHCSLPSSRSPY